MKYRPTELFMVASLALMPASHAVAQTAAPEYDLILRGGTVFDGTGAEGQVADVAVVGDRIVAVGDLSAEHARTEKDATGLYVTPGFVSVHDHSSPEVYRFPVNLLTQGITTAIANPDGGGPIAFVDQISVPMGLNYGAYIGFNTIWGQVVGADDRRASPAEIEQMRDLVRTAMDQGAFGLSAGLDYKPGFWADTDEVVAVASAAAPWRTQFTNHERVYPGNGYSSMAGMRETVAIGEQAGLMPVITHMKLQGGDQGMAEKALALATDAAERGLAVGLDAYPYTFGSTSLEQLTIPAWAQEGGEAAMLKRFQDPALRARIDQETNDQLDRRWGGAGGVYLAQMRRELTDIIAEMGGVSPGEAIMRLLEQGERRVLLRFGTEADQEALVTHPFTAVSCDCGATTSLTGHPRSWGSFPKFMGRYVREKKLVGWPEAIRKMTALPASMIGLTERGYLLPGMVADLTAFDPETVIDHATIAEPTLPSEGIEMVIVNGKVALADGAVSIEHPGTPLLRGRHEPARPMSLDRDRSVVVRTNAAGSGLSANIRLHQAANGVRPDGDVKIAGLDMGDIEISPSILQTTENWASITGLATLRDGRHAAITVVAEQADPLEQGKPSLTVILDGETVFSQTLKPGSVAVTQQ